AIFLRVTSEIPYAKRDIVVFALISLNQQCGFPRIRFSQTKSELLANCQFSCLSFNDNFIFLSCRNGENVFWMMSKGLLLQSNIQLSENFYYPFGLIHSSCADSFF